jgi:hypothetical protein
MPVILKSSGGVEMPVILKSSGGVEMPVILKSSGGVEMPVILNQSDQSYGVHRSIWATVFIKCNKD